MLFKAGDIVVYNGKRDYGNLKLDKNSVHRIAAIEDCGNSRCKDGQSDCTGWIKLEGYLESVCPHSALGYSFSEYTEDSGNNIVNPFF